MQSRTSDYIYQNNHILIRDTTTADVLYVKLFTYPFAILWNADNAAISVLLI